MTTQSDKIGNDYTEGQDKKQQQTNPKKPALCFAGLKINNSTPFHYLNLIFKKLLFSQILPFSPIP